MFAALWLALIASVAAFPTPINSTSDDVKRDVVSKRNGRMLIGWKAVNAVCPYPLS
jgi:hypothetical protein